MRHGQAKSNVSGFLPASSEGAPLTIIGEIQADEAGLFLKESLSPGLRVISSPQKRCVDTARRITDLLSTPLVEVDYGLDVRYLGAALGKGKEFRYAFNTYDEIPGAESTPHFVSRVLETIERLSGYDDTLLVTHSGVIRAARYVSEHRLSLDETSKLLPDEYRELSRPNIPNASLWRFDTEALTPLYEPSEPSGNYIL